MSTMEDMGKGAGEQSCAWTTSGLLQLNYIGDATKIVKIIYLREGYIVGIFLRLLRKLLMPFMVTRTFQIQF